MTKTTAAGVASVRITDAPKDFTLRADLITEGSTGVGSRVQMSKRGRVRKIRAGQRNGA